MTKKQLTEIIKRIIKEESHTSLTANVGGTRYQISRNGNFKRLGSEEMDFGDAKIVGAITDFGQGNRHITKDNIDITLKDIFSDPQNLVGKYPIQSLNGKLMILSGGKGSKESDYRVLWVK